MRRPDVEELLGKGDPDYPNSHGRILHYGADRRIPVGSGGTFPVRPAPLVNRTTTVARRR
jgi:hypothetical protein